MSCSMRTSSTWENRRPERELTCACAGRQRAAAGRRRAGRAVRRRAGCCARAATGAADGRDGWVVGHEVEVERRDRPNAFAAEVVAVRDGRRYDVRFVDGDDDGKVERDVPATHLRGASPRGRRRRRGRRGGRRRRARRGGGRAHGRARAAAAAAWAVGSRSRFQSGRANGGWRKLSSTAPTPSTRCGTSPAAATPTRIGRPGSAQSLRAPAELMASTAAGARRSCASGCSRAPATVCGRVTAATPRSCARSWEAFGAIDDERQHLGRRVRQVPRLVGVGISDAASPRKRRAAGRRRTARARRVRRRARRAQVRHDRRHARRRGQGSRQRGVQLGDELVSCAEEREGARRKCNPQSDDDPSAKSATSRRGSRSTLRDARARSASCGGARRASRARSCARLHPADGSGEIGLDEFEAFVPTPHPGEVELRLLVDAARERIAARHAARRALPGACPTSSSRSRRSRPRRRGGRRGREGAGRARRQAAGGGGGRRRGDGAQRRAARHDQAAALPQGPRARRPW